MLFVFNGFCRLVFVLFNSVHCSNLRRFCLEPEIGPEFQFCNQRFSSRRTSMFKQDWAIFVFSRTQPLARVLVSLRGSVISLYECTIPFGPCVPSVMKYCLLSTVFKPALEHSLYNFWSSDGCSNCCSNFWSRFRRRCPSVRGSAVGDSVGISFVSEGSCASLLSRALEARKTDGRFLGSPSSFSQKFLSQTPSDMSE